MMIQFDLGPQFQQAVNDIKDSGRRFAKGASEGLKAATKIAASNVNFNYLQGQALRRKSGNLARAVDGWLAAPFDGVIGVPEGKAVDKYKWLLSDEQMTITPKKSKFLAIPIGEGLTTSGVPRYASPRERPDGFFVRTGGKLLFGYKRGTTGRGKFRPLFIFVKSVFVQGSGALYDGVMDSVDDMTKVIDETISQRMG